MIARIISYFCLGTVFFAAPLAHASGDGDQGGSQSIWMLTTPDNGVIGDGASVPITFHRSGDISREESVRIQTLSANPLWAQPGVHYNAVDTVITFAPGQNIISTPLIVETIDGSVTPGGSRVFTVLLYKDTTNSKEAGDRPDASKPIYMVTDGLSYGDGDEGGVQSFWMLTTPGNGVVGDGDTVSFTMHRSGDIAYEETVRIETWSANPFWAQPGEHFSPLDTTVTFAPGQSIITTPLTVDTVEDSVEIGGTRVFQILLHRDATASRNNGDAQSSAAPVYIVEDGEPGSGPTYSVKSYYPVLTQVQVNLREHGESSAFLGGMIDKFKEAGHWMITCDDQSMANIEYEALTYNANGVPVVPESHQQCDGYATPKDIFFFDADTYADNAVSDDRTRWRIDWTGEGAVTVFGAANVSTGANFIEFDLTPDINFLRPKIVAGADMSQPRFYRLSDMSNLNAGEIFRDDYVQSLQWADILRFMNYQIMNNAQITAYEDMGALEDLAWLYGSSNETLSTLLLNGVNEHQGWGLPVRAAIRLAKRTGADPWIHVAPMADDDYAEGLAADINAETSEGDIVYVELGNEIWNGAPDFALVKQYFTELAATTPGYEDTRLPAPYAYGYKSADIILQLRALCPDVIIVGVLGTQTFRPRVTDDGIDGVHARLSEEASPLAIGDYFVLGVANYHNVTYSGAPDAPRHFNGFTSNEAFFDAIAGDQAALRAEIKEGWLNGPTTSTTDPYYKVQIDNTYAALMAALDIQIDKAVLNGMNVITYEGGDTSSFAGTGLDSRSFLSDPRHPEVRDFYRNWRFSAENGALFTAVCEGLRNRGVNIVSQFQDVGRDVNTIFGAFLSRRHFEDNNPYQQAVEACAE